MMVFLAVLGLGAYFVLADLVAFLVTVQWNAIGNWVLTFGDIANQVGVPYLRFHASSVNGLSTNQAALLFTLGLFALPLSVSNLTAIGTGVVVNDTGFEQFVFHEGEVPR